MKEIIIKHAGISNAINTDSQNFNNFLDRIDSGYQHNAYNRSNDKFCLISKIESIWAKIKDLIKKMYNNNNP